MLKDEERSKVIKIHTDNGFVDIEDVCKDIERAVLAKAIPIAKQEPVGIIGETDCLNDVVYKLPIGTKLYTEPQPAKAAAIPEGYEVQIDNDGSVHVMFHDSKTATEVECPILIRYFTDLLSASPSPQQSNK